MIGRLAGYLIAILALVPEFARAQAEPLPAPLDKPAAGPAPGQPTTSYAIGMQVRVQSGVKLVDEKGVAVPGEPGDGIFVVAAIDEKRAGGPWLSLVADVSGWAKEVDVTPVPLDPRIKKASLAIQSAAAPSWLDYNARGLLWIENQEWDLAILDFTEALRQNPHEARVYVNRGTAYYRSSHFDKYSCAWGMALLPCGSTRETPTPSTSGESPSSA